MHDLVGLLRLLPVAETQSYNNRTAQGVKLGPDRGCFNNRPLINDQKTLAWGRFIANFVGQIEKNDFEVSFN